MRAGILAVGLGILGASGVARAESSYLITDAARAVINAKRASYPWAEDAFQAVHQTGTQSGVVGAGSAISYVTVNQRALNTFSAAVVYRLTGDAAFGDRAVQALTDWRENALGRSISDYGYLGDPPQDPPCSVNPPPCYVDDRGTGALALVVYAVQHMAMAYDLLRDYPPLHATYTPQDWASFFTSLSAPSGGRVRSAMNAAVAIAQKSSTRAATALSGFHSELPKYWDETDHFTHALTGFEYGVEYLWLLGMGVKLLGVAHEMGLAGATESEAALANAHHHLFYRAIGPLPFFQTRPRGSIFVIRYFHKGPS